MNKEMSRVCEDFFSNKVIYENGLLITEPRDFPTNTLSRKKLAIKQDYLLNYNAKNIKCLACHRVLDVIVTKVFKAAESNFCPYCGCYIPEIVIKGE